MSDVRNMLERKAGRFDPDPTGWDRMLRRAGRRQRNRRIGAACVALVIFGATGTALFLALRFAGPASRPNLGTHVIVSGLHVTDLQMVTPLSGWAVTTDPSTGQKRVATTRDGGSKWRDVTAGLPQGARLSFVATFLDANHAWIAWSNGANPRVTSVGVLRTADGGHTWRLGAFTSQLGWDGHLQFVDAQHGWAVATIAAATGHDPQEVWHTTDGGATWTSVSVSSDPFIPGIPPATAHALPSCPADATFVDTSTGYAVSHCNSGAQLFATHDAGHTWFPVSVSAGFPREGGPGAPVFTSRIDGIIPILAPQGQGATGLFATHDGGSTWTHLTLPAGLADAGPTFSDSQHGWFFGRRKLLYATVDGGVHWSSFRPNLTLAGSTLQFIDPLHGWAFYPSGEHPWLLRTDDGGHRWEQLTPQLRG